MVLPPRVSLVTLGVRDLAAAVRFYEALGWKRSGASNEVVAFFHTGGAALALFGHESLAADAGLAATGASGFRGVALAANVDAREDVDAALAAAARAGARVVKEAADTTWGGRSGYFEDVDGHLWEVAWNPFFPLDATGSVQLP